MLFSELKEIMREFNKSLNIKHSCSYVNNDKGQNKTIIAEVVISNDLFNNELPREYRTYEFNNYNKALCSDDLGYSIFAYCKTDQDILRIERLADSQIEECRIIERIE